MRSSVLWPIAIIVAAAFLGAASFRAGANQAAAGKPAVVATVNLETLIEQLDVMGSRQAELEGFIQELRNRLKAKDDELVNLQDQIKILPDGDQKREKFKELRRKTLEYRFEAEYTNALIDERRGAIFKEVFEDALAAASTLAQRNGYDLVLNNDSSAEIPTSPTESQIKAIMINRRVFHAADTIDMTAELAQYMNNQHRLGAR